MDFLKNLGGSNITKTVTSALGGSGLQSITNALGSSGLTSALGGNVGSALSGLISTSNRDSGNIFQSLISQVYSLIGAKLPFDWGKSEEEEVAQDTTQSQFSTYMAQPTPKPIYQAELQQLDGLGAIDLNRITRDQWPTTKDTYYFVLISINTYEKETYALGKEVVTDAINIAKLYKNRGYRVAYLFNSSAKDTYKWIDYFVEIIKSEVTVYFSGIATNIINSGEITQVLAFRNESKTVEGTGGSATKIEAIPGIGTNSIAENYLLSIVDRTAKISLRTVFITNVVNKSSGVFTVDSKYPLLTATTQKTAKHIVPPHQTLYVQNNSSTNTNQHSFADKFVAALTKSANTTFTQLKSQFTTQAVAVAPNGGITIIANADSLLAVPVLYAIPPDEEELQLHDITPAILGTDPSKITSLPDTTKLSQAEIEGAEQRWSMFVAEMKKSPTYDSKYASSLKKLDSMGCINLERLDRQQIPNIRIDRVCALFFNPYEDLAHTLDLGPVNDGLTMAALYGDRGYKIVYLMDATPKEFYSWMDWLLSNVRGEIVIYFSGHGTQTRDTTGKEIDGMSELLVFYNDSLKTTKLPKISVKKGITDMTVSDDTLHELITLKDYPDTRIVLISDCCHSGTMYNFDQTYTQAASRPALNVVCVGAAKDEQTAKQTVLGGKESGVFTHSLDTVIKQKAISSATQSTFIELETYTKKNIAKYQDINITTTNKSLLSQPIIAPSKLSSDPTSRNYSPVTLTESQLKTRTAKAKTLIPANGKRVIRPTAAKRVAASRSISSSSSSSSSAAPAKVVISKRK